MFFIFLNTNVCHLKNILGKHFLTVFNNIEIDNNLIKISKFSILFEKFEHVNLNYRFYETGIMFRNF